MSQSIRSGKPAALSTPSFSFDACYGSILSAMNGQNAKRVVEGLDALKKIERYLHHLSQCNEDLQALVRTREKLVRTQEENLSMYRNLLQQYETAGESHVLQ